MINRKPRPRTMNEQKNDQLRADRRNEAQKQADDIIHNGFFIDMPPNSPPVSIVKTSIYEVSGKDICIVSGSNININTLNWNADVLTHRYVNTYYTSSQDEAAALILLGGKLNGQVEAIKNAVDITVGTPKQIAYAVDLRYQKLRNSHDIEMIKAISNSNDAEFIINA